MYKTRRSQPLPSVIAHAGAPCASGASHARGRAARHPLGLVDLVRGREEGRVDAAHHSRPACDVVVTVALKLPALDHSGADGVRQLRLCVVKHLLQGNLERCNALIVIAAKWFGA